MECPRGLTPEDLLEVKKFAGDISTLGLDVARRIQALQALAIHPPSVYRLEPEGIAEILPILCDGVEEVRHLFAQP